MNSGAWIQVGLAYLKVPSDGQEVRAVARPRVFPSYRRWINPSAGAGTGKERQWCRH